MHISHKVLFIFCNIYAFTSTDLHSTLNHLDHDVNLLSIDHHSFYCRIGVSVLWFERKLGRQNGLRRMFDISGRSLFLYSIKKQKSMLCHIWKTSTFLIFRKSIIWQNNFIMIFSTNIFLDGLENKCVKRHESLY